MVGVDVIVAVREGVAVFVTVGVFVIVGLTVEVGVHVDVGRGVLVAVGVDVAVGGIMPIALKPLSINAAIWHTHSMPNRAIAVPVIFAIGDIESAA